MRVGQFIGRLGVVSLPAVGAGLGLDERVVRRHVARLEAGGWLGRAPWVWGEGSVVWLTASGLRITDLGGLRPVKAPPSPTTVAHGLLVAWSAARMERRGLRWRSARELAADSDRRAVRMRDERGYRKQLPDLAVWRRGTTLPVAIVGEEGHRREDRQRMILEGWRDAIWSDRYAAIQYDCANAAVAARIARLAKKEHLSPPKFIAAPQRTAEEIRSITPDPEVEEPAPGDVTAHAPELVTDDQSGGPQLQLVPPPAPSPRISEAPPPPDPEESPEVAAERERVYGRSWGSPNRSPAGYGDAEASISQLARCRCDRRYGSVLLRHAGGTPRRHENRAGAFTMRDCVGFVRPYSRLLLPRELQSDRSAGSRLRLGAIFASADCEHGSARLNRICAKSHHVGPTGGNQSFPWVGHAEHLHDRDESMRRRLR